MTSAQKNLPFCEHVSERAHTRFYMRIYCRLVFLLWSDVNQSKESSLAVQARRAVLSVQQGLGVPEYYKQYGSQGQNTEPRGLCVCGCVYGLMRLCWCQWFVCLCVSASRCVHVSLYPCVCASWRIGGGIIKFAKQGYKKLFFRNVVTKIGSEASLNRV